MVIDSFGHFYSMYTWSQLLYTRGSIDHTLSPLLLKFSFIIAADKDSLYVLSKGR